VIVNYSTHIKKKNEQPPLSSAITVLLSIVLIHVLK